MLLLGILTGGGMSDDMGTFRTGIEIENPARPGVRRGLPDVLVDTGSELTWVPSVLLGARSLEGLNLRVDPVLRQLVDAGPAPAASTLPRLHARWPAICHSR
jgi:hypothetical protein